MSTDPTGTGAEPRWLDDDEMAAWLELVRVVTLLPQALDRQLREDAGIGHVYYQLLAMLSAAPEGTLRMSELARLTGISASRLSHAVSRLEAEGYQVESVRNALDEVERRADHFAAVSVEDEHLTQVRHHQHLTGVQNPRRQRHADDRMAPANPLRWGIRHDRARLPDVEVVEAVEHRAGQPPALPRPGAPALARPVVVLPHHE